MTSETVERLLRRLDGVRQVGEGWVAKCPAHDDARASLSIGAGADGRALLKCHAGCETAMILSALGLDARDLFETAHRTHPPHKVLASYDYTDDKDELLYQVVRFDPKDFRQRRPDGAGGWTWNLNGVERVPFRLSRVLDASRGHGVVWVVEGEKDALKLEALGLVATTNAGGAGKWTAGYAETMRGARGVYVIPDNDPPGQKHAEDVARSVHALGVPAKVVVLPGVPAKGDVSDWLSSGGTAEGLTKLAQAAPLWEPKAEADENADTSQDRAVVVTRACDITPVPVTWTWDERIPSGMLALVAGREGTGKSSMMIERAARLTRGDLDGVYHGTPRSVVIVAAEDSWQHTVVPRLMAAGADLTRVLRVQIATRDLGTCELSLPDDVDALRGTIRDHDVALVILDPLVSRLAFRLDTHRDGEVRQGLEPLARLADETGAAIIGLIHVSKAATRDPLTAILGSRGFVAVARAVLSVVQDPDDRGRRIVSQTKCNVGRDDSSGLPSLTYRVDGATIETAQGPAQTSCVVWTGETDRGVREIMAAAEMPGGGARTVAEDWLRDLLAGGAVATAEVKTEAQAAGLSWGTVRRVQEALGVRAVRVGGLGAAGAWYWEAPAPKALKVLTPECERLRGDLSTLAVGPEAEDPPGPAPQGAPEPLPEADTDLVIGVPEVRP